MTWPGAGLAEDLKRRFAAGIADAWSDDEFDSMALEAFRLQFESIDAFRGFCEVRGSSPRSVSSWQEVPAVPVTAFKHLDLSVSEPELVFRTSGTTRGDRLRGRHLVPDSSLYRASLLPPFEAHVLAGAEPMPVLSLIPPPSAIPDSSLSYMVGAAADALATRTFWLVDGRGRLDEDAMRSAMTDASVAGEPVLLLSTALALLHAVERLEVRPMDLLPVGSRIMETGGFKGLDREIGRDELYARVTRATGVPQDQIVSEYGMTELLSQLYEPVLSEGPGKAGVHVPPPWLRVRALDPTTLEEVAVGAPGVLCFFDLANTGSLCHVLTEDLGTLEDGGVRLQGRAAGAELRGCSRAMDDLMTAAGSVP